jgi:mRNA degradation ribonuclease J1/J2
MRGQPGRRAVGAVVDVDTFFALENAQVGTFDAKRARMDGSVSAGAVLVDGIAAVDGIDGVVLRDRRMLASDGVVMVDRQSPARTVSLPANPTPTTLGS